MLQTFRSTAFFFFDIARIIMFAVLNALYEF